MKVLKLILILFICIASLLVNSYIALNLYCEDCVPALAQANHIAHWITLTSVILLALVVVMRLPFPLLALQIPGVLAFLLWFGPLLAPKPTINAATLDLRFKALVYNQGGEFGTPDPKIEQLLAADADIVGIVEYDYRTDATMSAMLAERYPYQYVYPESYKGEYKDFRLLSRYPIVSSNENIPYPLGIETFQTHRFLRVELDMNGIPLAVYVFHPHRPPYALATRYDDTRLRENFMHLMQALAEEEQPTMLLCDCNFSPRSPQYHQLDYVLDDSFAKAGWGLGLTTSGLAGVQAAPIAVPLVRSDFIWTNIEVTPIHVEVQGSLKNSDHLMVVGEFSLSRYILEQ